MRTKRRDFAVLLVVLSCSMVLVSCDAITAQQITNTGSGSRMNGFPGMNGGTFKGGGRGNGGFPGVNGGTRRNGGTPRNGGQGMNGGSTDGSTGGTTDGSTGTQ
ncbi:hypothetical protein [Paenibacillus sp. sgz5001063]|uniref:hypothetical protein n=1 Tax=Paenibacillus sp. sgz5001063 TaxID=3242474 RepID=UPI0036D3F688